MIDSFKSVDGGHIAVHQGQDDRLVVLGGISHVLPDKGEIRPE